MPKNNKIEINVEGLLKLLNEAYDELNIVGNMIEKEANKNSYFGTHVIKIARIKGLLSGLKGYIDTVSKK